MSISAAARSEGIVLAVADSGPGPPPGQLEVMLPAGILRPADAQVPPSSQRGHG
jgi:hypothetical protein